MRAFVSFLRGKVSDEMVEGLRIEWSEIDVCSFRLWRNNITARVLEWAHSFAGQTVLGIVLGLGTGIAVPILMGGFR